MDPINNPHQSRANTQDSDRPSTPESRLSAHQMAEANNLRQQHRARKEHDRQWWASRHPMPKRGDPVRRLLFTSTSNAVISSEEAMDVAQKFKAKVTNPETGELEPMGLRLRPSTPPMERAEKARDRLVQRGVAVSDENYKTIFEQATENSGLDAAMLEYFQGKEEVPVQYVNELRQCINRLKMEMGMQLAKKEADFNKLSNDFDAYKKRTAKEKTDLEAKVQKEIFNLQSIISKDEGKFEARETENADLKDIIHHLQLLNDTLEKTNSEMQSELQARNEQPGKIPQDEDSRNDMTKIQQQQSSRSESGRCPANDRPSESLDAVKDELLSTKAKLVTERMKNDALESFYEAFYKDMQLAKSSWTVFIKAVTNMPEAQKKLSEETRQLIRKMYKDNEDLERKFLLRYPGSQPSQQKGQLRRNILTKAALAKAQNSLCADLERVMTLKETLIEHEREEARRLKWLDIATMGEEQLKQFREFLAVQDDTSLCFSNEAGLEESNGSSTTEEDNERESGQGAEYDWDQDDVDVSDFYRDDF
ncbi:hypothetical protein QQZ08_003830 [Neonectria magnoliae]|uniref:Uncharacterized protein n=1 Tax=Neonectria magnoliae TaxID=2732573 RepID=A0ABR1I9F3_9HYPO